ncbi:nitroreductase [Lactobacillus sp. PSON]|uniref:nitroreductase n=1 Tax=Lactobacillus sp. PSON TaxID=3455454 RepID=UPI004041D026
MEFNEVLNKRQSIRDFLDRSVSEKDIVEVIKQAQRAPSWANSQPWEVYVATGKTLEKIRADHKKLSSAGIFQDTDIPTMHRDRMSSIARHNAADWSRSIQDYLGSDISQMRNKSMNLFNAPVLVYLVLPKNTTGWSIYDLGAFGQTLMLAAANKGLDSMPAWEIVQYPESIKKHLGIPEDKILAMGIGLGYRNPNTKINKFYTNRANLDTFVTIKK